MTLLRDEERVGVEGGPGTPALVRYEDDAYGWALQQAALLRAGRFDALDLENLADEVADVAGREYDKLESALTRLLQHLLTWDHQPERRSRSWVLSIKEHRRRAGKLLRKHPGLKGELTEIIADAYSSGRFEALVETELSEAAIPETNPYDWEEIMTRAIAWPDE